MIWSSPLLMTSLDLVIVSMGVYSLSLIGRSWTRLRRHGLSRVFAFIASGLTLFVGFFLADLVTMHVVPAFSTMEFGMQIMTDLHLNLTWPTHVIAIGLITYGLRRYINELLPRSIAEAEALEERLTETTNEFEELSNRYQLAISGSSDGFWSWKVGSERLWCSPRYAELIGLETSGDVDLPIAAAVHPADEPRRRDAFRNCIRGSAPLDVALRLQTAHAGYRWFRVRGKAVRDPDARVTLLAGSLQDVHVERERDIQMHELAIAVENSMQGISRLGPDGRFTEVRTQYAAMLGYEPDELIGQDWRVTVAESDQDKAVEAYRYMIAEGRAETELIALRKDGAQFVKALLLVKATNEVGAFAGHFCFMRDVTQETELKKQLEFHARHDSLTRLINRREFELRLDRAIASAKRGGEHVLCYMDLDQFKVINDTLGHSAGDALLRRLSNLMHERIRGRDALARLGGDEFALLMEHCSQEDGVRTAIQLKADIEGYEFHWASSNFKVGVSMGVVLINAQSTDKTELLKKADSACYVAKEQGRNRLHVYHDFDPELVKRRDEMSWVSHINDALASDSFQLYVQPICSTTDGGVKHYEVLLRMQYEDEIVLPGVFLPAAERYNVATQVDRWVVEHTLDHLIANRTSASGEDGRLWAINLSGHSLGNGEFRDFMIAQMQRDPRLARHICFEITETAVISKLDAAKHFIAELTAFGCRFSLDDFGRGLSSFAYLRQLDVHFLKIDGSIVRDVASDDSSRVMVRSIHEISKVMGKQTVAEWVENGRTLDILRETGVDFVQGYHLGKPEPLAEVLGQESW